MRVFKTKPFARFAADNAIADAALCEAVRRARSGLVDADLGGGVIKQRVARPGQGKSGGYRTVMLFKRAGSIAVFAYGFAKNDRDNIDRSELAAFRLLAKQMLALTDAELGAAMKNGTILEIECDA